MTRAAGTTSQGVPELMTLSYTLFRALPLATAQWGLGQGNEKATTDAVWKVYDASVRTATMAIDTLYRTPLFSETVSSTVNQLLRWQCMSNAVNRVFLTSFWRLIGLPTTAEIQALTGSRLRVESARERVDATRAVPRESRATPSSASFC